jgi:tRNA threonylcarbamoyladenosine biosynthesis protein TsaE
MPYMNTEMIWQLTSTASADTEKLGELLGNLLKPPILIELRADLGGGKTTFVRGLARGLGSSDIVSSPTFTLNRVYKTRSGELHHFDFYRLSDPGVVKDQLEESLKTDNVITVVEWSNIVKDALPEKRLSVQFSPITNDPDKRQVEIRYPEELKELIHEIESQWAKNRNHDSSEY